MFINFSIQNLVLAGDKLQLMMFFSIGTGLERVGIAKAKLELPLGRSAGSGCCAPLQNK